MNSLRTIRAALRALASEDGVTPQNKFELGLALSAGHLITLETAWRRPVQHLDENADLWVYAFTRPQISRQAIATIPYLQHGLVRFREQPGLDILRAAESSHAGIHIDAGTPLAYSIPPWHVAAYRFSADYGSSREA